VPKSSTFPALGGRCPQLQKVSLKVLRKAGLTNPLTTARIREVEGRDSLPTQATKIAIIDRDTSVRLRTFCRAG
jgi:hypothetical protein